MPRDYDILDERSRRVDHRQPQGAYIYPRTRSQFEILGDSPIEGYTDLWTKWIDENAGIAHPIEALMVERLDRRMVPITRHYIGATHAELEFVLIRR